MTEKTKQPYIKFVRELDKIKIWVVDGNWIRTNINIEFINVGQHYKFNFIPKDEVWLDVEAVPDEQEFFIKNIIIEMSLMEKGVDYTEAVEAAGKAELKERLKDEKVKALIKKSNKDKLKAVKLSLWKKLKNGVNAWIVDGFLVRSLMFIDFTEGGHDLVYKFIPKKEIWIDNDLVKEERKFVLLHELVERNTIIKGVRYDDAHYNYASPAELKCRKNPELLDKMINREIRSSAVPIRI